MRIFVIHDESGAVREWIACPDAAPAPSIAVDAGLHFVEVEPPAGLPEDPFEVPAWLREAGDRFRAPARRKVRLLELTL